MYISKETSHFTGGCLVTAAQHHWTALTAVVLLSWYAQDVAPEEIMSVLGTNDSRGRKRTTRMGTNH